MSDPPITKCPQCGAEAERVLSGGGGLIFKGSGFYITDYRSESYKKSAESDSGAAPKSDAAKPDAAKSSPEPKPVTPAKPASSND